MSEIKLRKDWRPFPFAIPTVDLHFDIGDPSTIVTSQLTVQRKTGVRASTALVLDGRQMELLDILLDGQPLPATAYELSDEQLTIHGLPADCVLQIRNRINPHENTQLDGWYAAGDMLCSQCESHGFSRITYFPDRPDVMARYRTTLVADARRYPVLLSNGNPGRRRRLKDGRTSITWTDPHPKPCYLFAAVAGDLEKRKRRFVRQSGRPVSIEFYSEHGIGKRVDHAMEALCQAMRWDEQAYGCEYDLDRYLVVVASAFNMGAMENKGLNIFNPRYVLASPDTATDDDFSAVEAVVSHEYFHNWTGNRVTCRDWFQLSLKEGLTVFREQQFMATTGRGPAQRIDEVRLLRERQFAEDAGPLAHPVRPDSYIEMNNFYTSTVYEKGAELVRILHGRLGEKAFRRGMDRYFQQFDGQAVTIEDFLSAHATAGRIDTDGILRWYGQSGTPVLTVRDRQQGQHWKISLSQHIEPDHNQQRKKAVTIPLRLGALDAQGRSLKLGPRGQRSITLTLEKRQQSFNIPVCGVAAPVLLEGFSAPVKLDYPYSREQLQLLITHAEDAYARWDAAQRLYLMDLRARLSGAAELPDYSLFRQLLNDGTDSAVAAAILTPPRLTELVTHFEELDFAALQAALDQLQFALATALQLDAKVLAACGTRQPYQLADAGRRQLRARLLALWQRLDAPAAQRAAQQLYRQADNLSDRLHALSAVNRSDCRQRGQMLNEFARRYRQVPLVLDRWFSLQAIVPAAATVGQVATLLQDRRFDPANPNRVRAVLGSFGIHNPVALFHPQAGGCTLLAEQILQFDDRNPQLAARFVEAYSVWQRLPPASRKPAKRALQTLAKQARSGDVRERVERLLAS